MTREPLTLEELAIIHAAIGKENYADYVYAQCCLGLRPDEFVALKKSDVRREGDLLIITVRSRTDAGRDRSVPVSPAVREIIELRLRQPYIELLFPRADIRRCVMLGWKPLTCYYYNKRIFIPLMQQLGIPEGKAPRCAAILTQAK